MQLPFCFKVLKTYEDGHTFITARNPKYHGFLHMLQPYENLNSVLDAFDTFKKVVNGEIPCEVIIED